MVVITAIYSGPDFNVNFWPNLVIMTNLTFALDFNFIFRSNVMHTNKRLSKDSLDLSPSQSTEDSLDSISDTSEEVAINEIIVEDEDTQYKKLIGDFPVGLYVWKLEDPQNCNSLRLKFANHTASLFTGVKNESVLGKTIVEAYGNTNDSPIPKAIAGVATTGVEFDFGEITYGDDNVAKSVFRMKAFPLPNFCAGVLFENVSDARETESRRTQAKEQVESVLEQSIELMISANCSQESVQWMNSALSHLLTFADDFHKKVVTESIENQKKVVTAADISSLIGKLSVNDGAINEEYVNQFLISFRYFITPKLLLKKLVLRFIALQKDTKLNPPVILACKERLLFVFEAWIKYHFYDFVNDNDNLKTLQNFLNNNVCTSTNLRISSRATIISKLIGDKLAETEAQELSEISEITPKKQFKLKHKLTDFSSLEIANQFSLLTFDIFKSIRPVELYAQAWSKDKTSAANVVLLINNFNKYSEWIVSEIVGVVNIKRRVQVLKHAINIGYEAYKYRDYETCFMVTMALQTFCVSRLTETWKEIDFNTRRHWVTISEFASPLNNYKTYRGVLRKIFASNGNHSVLPYMGLYLRDLTFIEDGNVSFDEKGSVNFEKMRMVAKVITELQKAQKSSFPFVRNVNLLSWLLHGVPTFSEDYLYEQSKKCEAGEIEGTLRKKSLFSEITFGREETEKVWKNPLYGKKIPNMRPGAKKRQKKH